MSIGFNRMGGAAYHVAMAQRERDILERAVHATAEQAAKTNKIVDEAMAAGLARRSPGDAPSQAHPPGAAEGQGRPRT